MIDATSAKALSDFIDAWNAGERPRVADCLARVPEPHRHTVADQLELWLEVGPTPRASAERRGAIRTEPVVARLVAAMGSELGLLPRELFRLRARRSLSVRDLAVAVVDGLGLSPDDVRRVHDRIEQLEAGTSDATALSRRLIAAVAGALGTSTEALRAAATLSSGSFRLSTEGGTLVRSDPDDELWVEADLDALTRAAMAAAPEALDAVDRLFLGGWEA